MGNEARKIDQPDFTDEQLDSMASNDNGMDAKALEDITKVSGGIKEKIKDAELKRILDPHTADKLRTRLDQNSTNKQAIEKIGEEVDVIINFIRKLKSHKEIDKKTAIDNEIDEFLDKSPAEQAKYERGLADNLKVLDELYQKVTKLAPDRIQEFKNLTKGKIEFVQKILKEREVNKKAYQGLIEANADLFSKESQEEWIKEFEDLSSNAEQKKYLAEFQKQIEAKKGVMKAFKAFPEAIQKKFEAKFAKARRPERTIILQDMERVLEEEALDVLNNDPNAKHFSEKERASAMNTFKSKKTEEKTQMFGLLKGMLKYSAEMSKKYETLEPEIKLEVQQKMGFANYYELSFEDKTKAIKTGEELKEPNVKIENLYKDKLQKAVEQKYMSKESAAKFLQEFKDRDSSGKAEWLALFDSDQLAPRIQVTRDYQNAIREKYTDNQAKQEQLLNEFYGLGLTGRYNKLEGILGENLKDSSKVQTKKAAAAGPKEANTVTADREVTETDSQEDEETVDDETLDQALEKATGGEVMKDRRKRLTIAKELTDRERTSEQINSNTFRATQKTGRLKTGFEQALNKGMANHTDNEMILSRAGKAQEVRKVDVKKMNRAEKGDIFKLQREVTHTRGEKARKVDHIQFVNTESGQLENAHTANDQVEALESSLQEQAADRAAQLLESQGIKITPALLKALQAQAANTNMEVELEQTG